MRRQTRRTKAVNDETSKARQGQASRPCHPAGRQSRVIKFREGFAWEGIERRSYKEANQPWRGVSRVPLVGGGWPGATEGRVAGAMRSVPRKEPGHGQTAFAPAAHADLPFHLRYFEIEPGGYSTRERHGHEHVVTVLRGRGTVTLGDEVWELGFGDVVYVAPWEIHQFANQSSSEPFGFLCVVPAQRDRPEVMEARPGASDGRGPTE